MSWGIGDARNASRAQAARRTNSSVSVERRPAKSIEIERAASAYAVVVTQNPPGTGSPPRIMRQRLAPLPPTVGSQPASALARSTTRVVVVGVGAPPVWPLISSVVFIVGIVPLHMQNAALHHYERSNLR